MHRPLLLLLALTSCTGVNAGDGDSDGSSNDGSSSSEPTTTTKNEGADEGADEGTNESAESSTGDSTGEPVEPSVCGDLVAAADEECDSESLCKDCIRDRIVFVTNSFYQPPWDLAGADTICQNEAEASGLGGTFLAWLSVNDSSPIDRFVPAPGRYAQRDGSIVAEGWQGLLGGDFLTTIFRGPNSEDWWGRSAWTGTTADGHADLDNCNGWTAADGRWVGSVGLVGGIDESWTSNGSFDCRGFLKFYCFEQGDDV